MRTDNLVLMMKDIPVMRINLDDGLFEVINEKVMPYQMIGRIRTFYPQSNMSNNYIITQSMAAYRANFSAIISFLSARVLPLDRDNAKKILGLLRLEQAQSPEYRAKVALTCRAVSLQDNYWVKLEKDSARWADVDIRQNKLSPCFLFF